MLPREQKLNLSNILFFSLKAVLEVQSFGLDTGSQVTVLSIIQSCSKSAQKFAVQVCQVASVVMETTQPVLSQFKNFYRRQLIIEWGLSLPKVISNCCELVNLCHLNRRVPVVWYTCQLEVKVIWQKAPHGGPIPRLGVTPGGRKLCHWIPGVGFSISVP